MIAVYLWTASLMAYYSVYFHVRHLGGDFFLNIVVFSTCEISAYALGGYLTTKIGTKVSLYLSFLLASSSTLLYLLLPVHWTALSLAAAGFGIVWACNINWNGNALLFPV